MPELTEAQAILDIAALNEIIHRWDKAEKIPNEYGVIISITIPCEKPCNGDCCVNFMRANTLQVYGLISDLSNNE